MRDPEDPSVPSASPHVPRPHDESREPRVRWKHSEFTPKRRNVGAHVCVCVVPKRHMLLCYDAMLSLSRTRRSATGPAKAKVPLSLIRSHPKTVPKPGLSRCFGFPPLRFRMATCAPWSSRSHGPLGTVGRLDRGGGRNRCSSKAGREKLGGSNSWGSSSS